jgi:hypothetical protein
VDGELTPRSAASSSWCRRSSSGIPSSAGDRYRFSNAFTGFTTKKKTAAAIATNWMTIVMNAP